MHKQKENKFKLFIIHLTKCDLIDKMYPPKVFISPQFAGSAPIIDASDESLPCTLSPSKWSLAANVGAQPELSGP